MIWQHQKMPLQFLSKIHLLPKTSLGERTLLWSFWGFMCFLSHILLQGQLPQQTGSFKGAYTSGYEASEHRELRQERQNQRKHLHRGHTNTSHFHKCKAFTSLQCFTSKLGLAIFCDDMALCSWLRAERKKKRKKINPPKKSIAAIVGYWIKQDYTYRRQNSFFPPY